MSPASKLVFKLAFHHATRAGRQAIEGADLFAAIFEDSQGLPAAVMRRAGVEPEALVTRITSRVKEIERDDERLKKRYELPPFLKHFATNLNLLARQDKLPPVHGRDAEIQQTVEVLSHRERANSVMLIGEPGVGKTAIAEGLARRIEFEPETLPVRLRDCHIVSLQLNSLVAGTMLRGMFEDRMQNVLRELRERTNLILFIDEAHTLIGAGSALGAPSDAANILKGVLARGEVRIIGATTLSEYKEFIQEDEALARRFRTVLVAEPTIDETRRILKHVRPRLERNYGVQSTTTPSRWRWTCRRATCGTCGCPTRPSAGSTRPPCAPRSIAVRKCARATWCRSSRRRRGFPRTWCSATSPTGSAISRSSWLSASSASATPCAPSPSA